MTSFTMVGLGKMGANMARRLARAGVPLAGYDQNAEIAQTLANETGLRTAVDLTQLIRLQPAPRVVWLMLPNGEITTGAIDTLLKTLAPGDVIVEGGNSNYRESLAHAKRCLVHGIHFADCGVSGGVHGLENGYALMFGGDETAARLIEPFVKVLAPAADRGWLHCGAAGSGHYVKMIHNGIEYGMMQAFGEGFALLAAKKEFDIDLAEVAELWRHGSVVRSWLLDLMASFLKEDGTLESIQPHISDSGTGRWTAQEAIDLGVPAPVITASLMARFASQGNDEFSAKVLAKMREGFGGHDVKKHD